MRTLGLGQGGMQSGRGWFSRQGHRAVAPQPEVEQPNESGKGDNAMSPDAHDSAPGAQEDGLGHELENESGLVVARMEVSMPTGERPTEVASQVGADSTVGEPAANAGERTAELVEAAQEPVPKRRELRLTILLKTKSHETTAILGLSSSETDVVATTVALGGAATDAEALAFALEQVPALLAEAEERWGEHPRYRPYVRPAAARPTAGRTVAKTGTRATSKAGVMAPALGCSTAEAAADTSSGGGSPSPASEGIDSPAEAAEAAVEAVVTAEPGRTPSPGAQTRTEHIQQALF